MRKDPTLGSPKARQSKKSLENLTILTLKMSDLCQMPAAGCQDLGLI